MSGLLCRAFTVLFILGLLGNSANAAERLTPLPDGTLLFLENCSLLVEGYTRSNISHVALVMREDETTWVYEAAPAKVRRMPLPEYYREISKLNLYRKKKVRVWVMPPKRHFNRSSVTSMKDYLDEQIGRRYSVKGIVRGKKGDGIHCSQLASRTLQRAHKLDLEDSHLITPGELMGIVGSYYPVRREAQLPNVTDDRKWCTRSWDRFKNCFTWCSWGCRETFSWLY